MLDFLEMMAQAECNIAELFFFNVFTFSGKVKTYLNVHISKHIYSSLLSLKKVDTRLYYGKFTDSIFTHR